MSDRGVVDAAPRDGREPVWLYAGAIVTEAVVIALLWLFSRYFGA